MIFLIIEKKSSIPALGGDMYTKKSAIKYLAKKNVEVDVESKMIILKTESRICTKIWDAITFLLNKKSYMLRDLR